MAPDDDRLMQLKRWSLEKRLSEHPPEFAELVYQMQKKGAVALSFCGEGMKTLCYFVCETCEAKRSKWGKTYWWIRFQDDCPQLRRPYSYSDSPVSPGSLCLARGGKRGHWFNVDKVKLISDGSLPAGSVATITGP